MKKHDLKAAAIVAAAFANGRVMEAHRGTDGSPKVAIAGRAPADTTIDQVAAAAKKAVDAIPDPGEELARDASARLMKHRDAILRMLLADLHAAGKIDTADPFGLDQTGRLKTFQYQDGRMEYELDEKVICTFDVPAVAYEESFLNVNQTYRVAL